MGTVVESWAQPEHLFPKLESSCPTGLLRKKALTVLLFVPQVNKCSHFFQLKNISFCGYHPKNNK